MSHDPERRILRLDLTMVEQGLAPSRSRAQDLIRRGMVEVAGVREVRPAVLVPADATIALRDGSGAEHVSRGAIKLLAALDHFPFAVGGVVALDIGASTGGFTQVLLSRGAVRVYAVDVGHGQLHPDLATDTRVVALERCDARRLDRHLVPVPIGAVVADVSFISLTKALPAALALTQSGAWLIALVKPQFEAGRSAVGKGGVVRDTADRQRAVDLVRDWLTVQPDWRVLDVIASPITGGSGNEEFLLGAMRDG